jgi:ubiquinone/menaquinone biosynthesis C-methylase UbiE
VPSLREIAREWDANASARCSQIESGKDISHDKILIPAILKQAGSLNGRVVLDVGCGCGFLTALLGRSAKSAYGIDISRKMIKQAKQRFCTLRNVRFAVASVEKYAKHAGSRFHLCVANMSIITMPRIDPVLRAVSTLLVDGGRLIFSISHPCFWNSYRGDERVEEFNYLVSHPVTAPFRITLDPKPLPVPTTYFHRPLSVYISAIHRTGFQLEHLAEPGPPLDAPSPYRAAFRFPRFLVCSIRKRRRK